MSEAGGRTSDEQVAFIAHHRPGLAAGKYELALRQDVVDGTGAAVAGERIDASYRFAVRSDRFRLKNPSETIYGFFPADNASGEYSAVLPHVTFTRKTFPWSRMLTPGSTAVGDLVPWLAVLLVDEDDLPAPVVKPATIGDLFPGASGAADYSYFGKEAKPSELDDGGQAQDPITVLDIALGLFWRIAPTAADLKWLAHARRVSLVNKPTSPGAADHGEPVGDFSVVFGSRLPQAGRKARALLVSLEGLERFLPTDPEGGAPPGGGLAAEARLRLAVLANWTFFSTGDASGFDRRLMALDLGVDGSLRLPGASDDPTVAGALGAGYAPIDHDLRDGGRTVSWYRGPLTPRPAPARAVGAPYASPDSATRFDPTTGLFDASLACAWTLGRMLALQDAAFSASFHRWRKGLTREAAEAVEDAMLRDRFGPLLAASPAGEAPRARVAASLWRSTLMRLAEGAR
jgi:hypothetical protein